MFMYVYFYSQHVSGSHVPIIRRIIVSMRHLIYVTLCMFMYVYFYSQHVSGSHVPIIRRIILSMRHLVYVTLCR